MTMETATIAALVVGLVIVAGFAGWAIGATDPFPGRCVYTFSALDLQEQRRND